MTRLSGRPGTARRRTSRHRGTARTTRPSRGSASSSVSRPRSTARVRATSPPPTGRRCSSGPTATSSRTRAWSAGRLFIAAFAARAATAALHLRYLENPTPSFFPSSVLKSEPTRKREVETVGDNKEGNQGRKKL